MAQAQLSQSGDKLASLRIDRSDYRRPSSRWGLWFFLLVVLPCMAAGGAYAWFTYGEQMLQTGVRVASAEARLAGVADSVLAAQGYLKSRTQAAIGAKVAGRVSRILVEEGMPVDPEAILAELEHGDMDALLEAMEASLKAMNVSLDAMTVTIEKSELERDEAKSVLDQDERDLGRTKQLFSRDGASKSDLEKAESKYEASRARWESLVAAVKLAKLRRDESEARELESKKRIKEVEEQRKNFIITAPKRPMGEGSDFKWTVISKEAEVGESITPGGMGTASGRGSVVTLANLLNLEVETDVKEDYVSRVKADQKVSVAVDGVPDRRFTGLVRTIIPMGDRARGTVKVKVQLNPQEVREVNDPLTKRFTLFPEMAATVHFMSEGKDAQGGKVDPQVYAHADAVRKDDNGSYVWQVVEGRLSRVSIETGDTRDGRVLVQRGLKGGEQLVINPPDSLKESQLVKVVQ